MSLTLTEIEAKLAPKFDEIKAAYSADLQKLYEVSVSLFGSKFAKEEETTLDQARVKVEFFIALQIKTAMMNFIQNTPEETVANLLKKNVSTWLSSKDLTKIPFSSIFDFKDYLDPLIDLIVSTVYNTLEPEVSTSGN
jgi:hypothetical protein